MFQDDIFLSHFILLERAQYEKPSHHICCHNQQGSIDDKLLFIRPLYEVVKQHFPPLRPVTLDICNVEVEKKLP